MAAVGKPAAATVFDERWANVSAVFLERKGSPRKVGKLNVSVKPFQRLADSKGGALGRRPQSAKSKHPKSVGGELKQSGGLFWCGEPSPGVPRCRAQISQNPVKRVKVCGNKTFRSSLFKGLRIPKAAPLVADRSRRNPNTPKAQEGRQNSPADCFGVGNPRRFPGAEHKFHKNS